MGGWIDEYGTGRPVEDLGGREECEERGAKSGDGVLLLSRMIGWLIRKGAGGLFIKAMDAMDLLRRGRRRQMVLLFLLLKNSREDVLVLAWLMRVVKGEQ